MSGQDPAVPGPDRSEEPNSPSSSDTASGSARGESDQGLVAGILSIAGLSSLALAQPVYDALRRAPEFFAIRNLYMGDLLALIVLVAAAPTLALSIPAIAARLSRPCWTRPALALPVGLLSAAIGLQTVRGLPAPAAAAIALTVGAVGAWSWRRFRAVRSFALLLSAAAILAPALLVLDGRVRRSAARPADAIQAVTGDTGARAPVVLVIFDEWSLTSILDAEGSIDRERLPNLARLADQATWYPNATAAADASELAVPAMLTGREAMRGRLPTAAENPVNLFTVLAPSHDISAIEPVTSLCPPELNLLTEPPPAFRKRLGLLASDLTIVWLNLTLPAVWTERLPDVTRTWSAFGGAPASEREVPPADKPIRRALRHLREVDRAAEFRRLVDSIGPRAGRPGFYFLHTLLPHIPWEYLPSGRSYRSSRNRVHGLEREVWTTDPWPVRHYRKRYLLQVEFVDRLIGELIEKLESVGLFDESVLVITADHGVAFNPGRSRRLLETDDASGHQPLDLAAVPLIVKAPRQRQAEIDYAVTPLVGLTRRILELAGAGTTPIPRVEDAGTPSLVGKYAARVVLPVDREPWRRERLAEQAALLGETNDPTAIGAAPDLHGLRISDLPLHAAGVGVEMDVPALWDRVDPAGTSLPALVQGTLKGPESLLARTVAVALNGVVAASVRPHRKSGGAIRIAALLPERQFRAGLNQLDVFLVSERAGVFELERVERPPGFVYSLSWGEPGEGDVLLRGSRSALDDDVERIPVVRDDPGLIGYLDIGHRENPNVHGWAADHTDPGGIQDVVAFLAGRQHWIGSPLYQRPDVANTRGPEHILSGFTQRTRTGAGFDSEAPADVLDAIRREGIVAYAVSFRGIASRLRFFYAPLESDQNGVEILRVTDGRRLPVRQTDSNLEGAIDLIVKSGKRTLIEGWAADVERGERPRQIVIYRDGKFLKSLGANRERPDVVRRHDAPRLLHTGFRGAVPGAPEPATFAERHRVFALMLSGSAVELPVRAAAAARTLKAGA